MTRDTKVRSAVLLTVMLFGAVTIIAFRVAPATRVFEAISNVFGITLLVVIISLAAGSLYVRKKRPVLAVAEQASAPRRNPVFRDLVAAFIAISVGFLPVAAAITFVLRTAGSSASWLLLVASTFVFAAALLFALPRIHRFAIESAEQLVQSISEPPNKPL